MLNSLHAQTVLNRMSVDIDGVMQANQKRLLNGISLLLDEAEQLLPLLPPSALALPSSTYTRHLVYADELGRYSAMLLVWHPGQQSPVHGHRTWCTYKVLQGQLKEHHYKWNAEARRAEKCGEILRQAGDVVSAPAGLADIHQLVNQSAEVAVSLHIYGVDSQRISTHVNYLMPNA
ncbi:cysteine dioxygenase family protein [Advenella kashmirensis]|nr:cysteine dioxygenase family protein [Advenella kashmirensis]